MRIIKLYLLLISVLLFSCNKETELYEVTSNRQQLFDFNWQFQKVNPDTLDLKNLDPTQWTAINIPHDYSIQGEFNANNPMGNDGGYLPAGIGIYQKEFNVPANLKSKQFNIYFEGVYMNAEVFLNGHYLGVQPYGYTSFYFNLTPHIQFGTKNTLTVKVDNSNHKNSRWYSGSGIYRHVWLYVKNPVHINHWGVYITTPNIEKNIATIQVETNIKNNVEFKDAVIIKTTILDKGEEISTTSNKITNEIENSIKQLQTLKVEHPKLWDTNNPYLYQAKVQIIKDDEVIDEQTETFGIRQIRYNVQEGFKLNGESIILYGGCVHHDHGALGAASYNRAEERKVELLKNAGFNAVRTSHNPPAKAFLDACDKLGLLVIDESFDGWKTAKTPFDYSILFNDWWQHDVSSMVKRDRNHPSVIMWSIGNEIIERKDPDAVKTAQMLSAEVKKHDSTRPVTSAMTTWDGDWKIFDPLMAAHDICGYNYQLHRAEDDHKRAPERVILQTESYPRDAFSNWKLVNEHPYVIGDFVWTAIDYLGESGIGRTFYPGELPGQHWENNFFPWHGAYCGDIDLIGWRKPVSHYREMLFQNKELLYMAVQEPNPSNGKITETMWSVWPTWENWTWPGYEGKELTIDIYSRYPQIKLYLNNQLIASKKNNINNEFKLNIPVLYQKGKLRAEGLINGKVVDSTELKTAKKAKKIVLNSDRTQLIANGQDLAYISVEITDNNGIIQFNSSHTLNFEIEGEGEIIAVDNALLKDTTAYTSTTRNAWHGKAMAIVKTTKQSGEIVITVKNNELGTSSIRLKSK